MFKDEVRAARPRARPDVFVGWHPFPGPGLAIRCSGAITKDKLDTLRRADDIYISEICRAGLYDTICQTFAVIRPVKTGGDGRCTFESVLGLRAMSPTDGMTVDSCAFGINFLGRLATSSTR